jgi:hypothetical protein
LNLSATDPLSILAHQLRRRIPSNCSLFRGAGDLLDCAARGFAGLSFFRPGVLEPKFLEAKTIRCSAALLGLTTPASRFALAPKCSRPRRAREDQLFRRLFPAGPDMSSKAPVTACRRRSDLWSPAARRRLGPPSRSPMHHAPVVRVAKAKNEGLILWIMGISGTIAEPFRFSQFELIRGSARYSRRRLSRSGNHLPPQCELAR